MLVWSIEAQKNGVAETFEARVTPGNDFCIFTDRGTTGHSSQRAKEELQMDLV
jgi:hypothetical protein